MSVIINNMAMPQNCYECRFCETYLGHHLCVAYLNYIADPRSGRLDTCPLVEVQEPKRGKWICFDGKYYCSECDEEQDWMTCCCSGCGARMDDKEQKSYADWEMRRE